MFASSVASALSWAVFAATISNEVGIAFVTAFFGFLTSSLAAYLAYKTRKEAKVERGAVRKEAATVRRELHEEAAEVRSELGVKSDTVAVQATKERRIEHDEEGDGGVLLPPTPEGSP
jgi:uncharacterized protein (DUF58 family)